MRKPVAHALLFIPLVLIAGGCWPFMIGDGYAKLAGRAIDEHGAPYEACTIEFFAAKVENAFVHSRQIEGVFLEGFVIAPYAQDYEVRLSCAGARESAATKSFRIDKPYWETPLDLGTFVLARKLDPATAGVPEAM